jgi:hypothetical protein
MGQKITIEELFFLKNNTLNLLIPNHFNQQSVLLLDNTDCCNNYKIIFSNQLNQILEDIKYELELYFGDNHLFWKEYVFYYILNNNYMPYHIMDNLIQNKVCFFKTLNDAFIHINDYNKRYTLYVKEPWEKNSETMICYLNYNDQIEGNPEEKGFAYFLEVSIIKELIDSSLNFNQQLNFFINYAKNDA